MKLIFVIVTLACTAGCSTWGTVDRAYTVSRRGTQRVMAMVEQGVEINKDQLTDEELTTLKDLKAAIINVDMKATAARPALKKALSLPK